MARENVDSLIDELDDFAADISSIANDNKAVTFIIGLEQLANDSASFGGKIAQICPAKIREQKAALENALKQFAESCKGVANNLTGLKEMLENMPLKELRGTNLNSATAKAQVEKSIGIDNNGVGAQTPVMAPDAPANVSASTGPKSAMLQANESSVWNNLKGQFRFTESLKSGFDWSSISENVDALNIDVSATTEGPKQTLFESIISSGLPKSAGDLNSKPDPRDSYDYNSEYADVLPGEVPHFAEAQAPVAQEPTVQHMTESVAEPVSPKTEDINTQAHSLFENSESVSSMSSLSETIKAFGNSKDFDFENLDLELENTDRISDMSLEGHLVE